MSKPLDLFYTVVQVPPGAPWVQRRAAQVAAELESPLATGTLEIAMVRLGPWASDAPAQLAIGYLRATDEALERRRSTTIDGREVEFVFRSRLWLTRRRQGLVVMVAAVVVTLASFAGAAVKWTAIRQVVTAELDARVQVARRTLAQQRQLREQARRLAVMQQGGLLGRSGKQVAEDLAWLGAQRSPSVSLKAAIWRDGNLEVESEQAPTPSAESVGPGRWLVAPMRPEPPAASFGKGWRPSMRRDAP